MEFGRVCLLFGFGYIGLSSCGCMLKLHNSLTRLSLIITITNMPKYAVAKGRKTGVYDSWAECQKQTKGFTGAVFKKFDLAKDAEDFIRNYSGASLNTTIASSTNFTSIENKNSDKALPVSKISPSNTALHDMNSRLTTMESKLSNLIDHVTNAFSDIKRRLTLLEGKTSLDEQLLQLENKDREIASSSNKKGRKRRAEDNGSSEIPEDLNVPSEGNEDEDSSKDDTVPVPKGTKLAKCKIIDEIDGSYGVSRSVVNSGGFLVNPFGAVVVYTDGACTNNGKANAKAGIGVWFNKGHPLNIAAPVRGRATNNNAEIQAATAAIIQASKNGIRNLHVFTDSKFLINCITTWIYKWKRNNWQTIEGKPVINKVELVELDDSINQHMESVVWTYVKGHSNDLGNTSADELARYGAANYSKTSSESDEYY